MSALRVVLRDVAQAAYPQRAKEVHPDKGGAENEIRALGEARGTCLRLARLAEGSR